MGVGEYLGYIRTDLASTHIKLAQVSRLCYRIHTQVLPGLRVYLPGCSVLRVNCAISFGVARSETLN